MKIVTIDSETRSCANLKVTGAYNYAHHPSTRVLMWAWSYGLELTAPVKHWTNPDFYEDPKQDEHALSQLFNYAKDKDVYFLAHNAFFDRHIWNQVFVKQHGAPEVPLDRWLCSQAQAEASTLPGGLDKAAEMLGIRGKVDQGKKLIAMLCDGNNAWTDKCVEAMPAFVEYGRQDIRVCRELFVKTRPLNAQEWSEYHDNEVINDAGLPINAKFARAAAAFSVVEKQYLDQEMHKLTGGFLKGIFSQNKPQYIDRLLEGNVTDTAAELIEATTIPDGDDSYKRSFARRVREEFDLILAQDHAAEDLGDETFSQVLDFLNLCKNAGTTAAKYQKMYDVGGDTQCVRGTYKFNGAKQTGRASSRGGINLQNLAREVLSKVPQDILDVQYNMTIAFEHGDVQAEAEALREEYGSLQRVLKGTVRSAIMPSSPDEEVASYDLKQGEARVCPWQTGIADHMMEKFTRDVDFYTIVATELFGRKVTKDERQAGKVVHLAAQFLGGAPSIIATGKSYGLDITVKQAEDFKNKWRKDNSWAPKFGRKLKDATFNALEHPGRWFSAGKMRYIFAPKLMGGTLLCQIPSGRFLCYRKAKIGTKTWKDGRTSPSITYERATKVRRHLWQGLLIENCTQATQADLLRHFIERALRQKMPVRGHTHDELIMVTHKRDTARITDEVLDMMRTDLPSWAAGMPMDGEATIAPFHTK